MNAMPSRRTVLKSFAAAAALSLPRLSLAQVPGAHRFVLVVLRGGLDGLAAVPPVGDPQYGARRGALALSANEALPLDGFFALHPSLEKLHAAYARGEMLAIHATASPYRNRSHFDGQDLLENGTTRPHAATDGWLNRTVAALGGSGAAALAVGQTVPLVLRGDIAVANWAPSVLPTPDEAFFERLGDLYSNDPVFGPAFAEAMRTQDMGGAMDGRRPGRGAAAFGTMATVAGRMLSEPSGPRLAVMEMGGWDTHANQGTVRGRLANNLAGLDAGLDKLRLALGSAWPETVVVAVTEFGRTAAANGTGGTDHGTAGVALMVGGGVRGGRVVADWPGLASGDLHEGRDLRPTLDLRSVFKGILADHLSVGNAALDRSVFPDSGGARPMPGLVLP
ncbi:MAG: DUF1501 domain-containing protein [Alphaproteobacteria bacterium]|nr:DUF1501 domain-containing protein [Alphaproteobacteria bacterium]